MAPSWKNRPGRLAAARCGWLLPLLLAGCGVGTPVTPTTPDMPPLAGPTGEPLPPDHWFGASGTCTGEQPATAFGLVAGHAYRFEVKVVPEAEPAAVDVRLDEGRQRSFARLPALVEGGGDGSRLVVHRGTTWEGQPRVFAWAGADRRFHFPREACQESVDPGAGQGAPAPEPAPEPPPASLAPPSGRVRYAGGRTVAWWQERLSALRRDGPAELHRLSLQRARAAGLSVEEGAAGVVVTAGEAP